MTRHEFIEKYTEIIHLAILFNEKARRESILSLHNELNNILTTNSRDIFKYGIYLVVGCIDSKHIEKILNHHIVQTEDHDERTLKLIQKEAVLAIQQELNTRIMLAILNSYTDISLAENKEIINAFDDILSEKKELTPAKNDTGKLSIIETLTNKQIQSILRNSDRKDLVLSLLGASNTLREVFFTNMSPGATAIIKEDMVSMRFSTLADIVSAQERLIALIKQPGE